MKTINCWKCGKKVPFKGGNHKYCDTCCGEAKKDKKRLWRERYRREHSHICVKCGRIISNYNSNAQKYCKACSGMIGLENVRLAMRWYRLRWKGLHRESMGSGWLSHKPRGTFDDEISVMSFWLLSVN